MPRLALPPPVRIQPVQPRCVRGHAHDWAAPFAIVLGRPEDPGVYGCTGSRRRVECCMSCGCAKVTDEHLSATTVSYVPGCFLRDLVVSVACREESET